VRSQTSANHRIDTISQIDNNDKTTPVQQPPSRRNPFVTVIVRWVMSQSCPTTDGREWLHAVW